MGVLRRVVENHRMAVAIESMSKQFLMEGDQALAPEGPHLAKRASLLLVIQNVDVFDDSLAVTVESIVKAHACQSAFERIVGHKLVPRESGYHRQQARANRVFKKAPCLEIGRSYVSGGKRIAVWMLQQIIRQPLAARSATGEAAATIAEFFDRCFERRVDRIPPLAKRFIGCFLRA